MLNEPFGILDNIPLIWCFASFQTYESRALEIATPSKASVTPHSQHKYSLYCLVYSTSALSSIFTPITLNLVSVFLPAPWNGDQVVLVGEGR